MADISVGSMMAGALSLTAALAWNETAKTGIEAVLPQQGDTFKGLLVYAISVTILVIILAVILQNLTPKIDKAVNDLAGSFTPSAANRSLNKKR